MIEELVIVCDQFAHPRHTQCMTCCISHVMVAHLTSSSLVKLCPDNAPSRLERDENHWVPNLDCLKGGPTFAIRTFAANYCAMCSQALVWKIITLSFKRNVFPRLPPHKHFSMMASTLPADVVTLYLFLGKPDSFHSMVNLLLVGVKWWIHSSLPTTTSCGQFSFCCTVLRGTEKYHCSSQFVVTC